MNQIYLCAIMGQGGAATSPGVGQMADQTRALGIECDVFEYGDVAKIDSALMPKLGSDHLIAGLGYSLGCSTLTYLQSEYEFDLVLCVAASDFGQNYKIAPTTKRSVLWRNPSEPLSAAGGDLGFTVIHDMPLVPHLLMDMSEQ
jgi:homoserine acetyltransferase